ncbi:hypothetical protein OH491_25795 [Termitidicoccus mucosus]|uniref:Uncharacterized protein n=1 Tax=Termitidicoccus mucosus TaxID=1184151 RepID=A0A178IMK8_9BACT|nr:hypothetical protein AW736_00750 [Opitutaceae bacterium TSB47]
MDVARRVVSGRAVIFAKRQLKMPEKDMNATSSNTLPMVRYSFVVRGRMEGGYQVQIRGRVYARKESYYQAQAFAYDSILRSIPSFQPDEDDAIALKMLKR